MKKEVIIIGNGIAGVTLAVLLQRKNIPFVLLYREEEKLPFALGETLPPSAMSLLNELELLSLFEENAYRKTYGYHSMWGSSRVTDMNFYHQNPYKNGLKINKHQTLEKLRETIKDNMVSYRKGFEIIHEEHGNTVVLAKNEGVKIIQGKILIDATGRNRAVLQKLKIESVIHDELVAVSCHIPKIKHPKLTHEVYVESFKDGWGIVSALSETENICTIFTNKGNEILAKLKDISQWKSTLAETVYLKDFLTENTEAKIKGGNANSSVANQLAGTNWLALGDAAMSFDPLSSHGITNAMYTSAKALEAIEKKLNFADVEAFPEYDSTMKIIFQQYLQSKNRLYQQEIRWKDVEFWERFF
ncbi:Putative FAD-dependent oxidoreductase LodB [Kordia antarctica]|uniref:FAD-dependent oxidoreductase LodB n=1 Tax=Kordia antarctica TaxID=1218801 RepID=A0A7L4ZH74_9FLAO|nr:FAD-dependent monooxygenase [Kordia antarctica]QHI35576.1 Putative FAD-dependent oxidoreductase LodB [Kordia antarctica]